MTNCPCNPRSRSRSLALSISLSLALSRSPARSRSLSRFLTFSLTLSLSHTHSLSLALSRSLARSGFLARPALHFLTQIQVRNQTESVPLERPFCIDNLLVRIHFIIAMIGWTGLAPWESESPFPGSLTSPFQGNMPITSDNNKNANNLRGRRVSQPTLQVIQGQILTQSPTDANRFWSHWYES